MKKTSTKEISTSQLLPEERANAIERRAELAGAILEFACETNPDFMKQSQEAIANITGLSRPDVSRLLRGDVERFTLDRLFKVGRSLGARISITAFPEQFSARPTLYSKRVDSGAGDVKKLREEMHGALNEPNVEYV
jgi:predicted XRE-type DNA-binding protein